MRFLIFRVKTSDIFFPKQKHAIELLEKELLYIAHNANVSFYIPS